MRHEPGSATRDLILSRTFGAVLLAFYFVANSDAAPFVGPATKLNGQFQGHGGVTDYAISADNRWVAYLADQDEDQVPELFCRPIAGSGAPIKMNGPLVAGGNVSTFSLSPNGARVVYVADQ